MKKNRINIIFLSLLFCSKIFAQSYTLLHSTHPITKAKSSKILLKGDKIEASEMISIKDTATKCAVIQNGKGIFLLKLPAANNGLTSVVKNSIREFPKGMSSRTKPLQTLADVINCFGERTILSGQMSIYFGKFPFALTDSNYFFVKILSGGQEIRKRLDHRNDTVYFFEKDLRLKEPTDTEPAETKVKIFYKVNNNTVTITETTFISPSKESLLKDLTLINETMGKGNENGKITTFGNYLSEFYGKCDETDVKALMKDLIKTEKK